MSANVIRFDSVAVRRTAAERLLKALEQLAGADLDPNGIRYAEWSGFIGDRFVELKLYDAEAIRTVIASRDRLGAQVSAKSNGPTEVKR